MTTHTLFNQIESLPAKTKKKVLTLIMRILDAYPNARQPSSAKPIKQREFGCLAGKIHLSKDFDATPSSFKDYVG